MSETKRRTIVAEVPMNWTNAGMYVGTTISSRFEEAIAVNAARGYRLASWRFSVTGDANTGLNETIIAVFELEDTPSVDTHQAAVEDALGYHPEHSTWGEQVAAHIVEQDELIIKAQRRIEELESDFMDALYVAGVDAEEFIEVKRKYGRRYAKGWALAKRGKP